MYMQCAHRVPTAIVPNNPNTSPPFLKALAIARVPVPILLFIRCNKAPIVLEINTKNELEDVIRSFDLARTQDAVNSRPVNSE